MVELYAMCDQDRHLAIVEQTNDRARAEQVVMERKDPGCFVSYETVQGGRRYYVYCPKTKVVSNPPAKESYVR